MTQPVVLDGGDRRCVELLIALRRLTLTVPAGTVIHVVATDPAAPLDLPAWCHLTGHAYLGPVPGTGRATYAVRVAAVSVPTDAAQPWRTTPDDGT
jgi:tRNA 2-thiouridine synthesizing protein A